MSLHGLLSLFFSFFGQLLELGSLLLSSLDGRGTVGEGLGSLSSKLGVLHLLLELGSSVCLCLEGGLSRIVVLFGLLEL